MSIAQAKASDLLTQKELMGILGVTSKRSVQRFRNRYKVSVVDCYGQNPLFDPNDVERAIAKRKADFLARMERRGRNFCKGVVTVKEALKRAGRGRKKR